MTICDTLYLILGLQTLVITTVFYFYKSPKRYLNRYLALFFFTLTVEILLYFLQKFFGQDAIRYLPLRFDFLSMNFLYIYSLKTLGKEIKSIWKTYIPAVIEIIIFSFIFTRVHLNPEYHEILQEYNFFAWYYSLSSSYIVIISILIIKNNRKHIKALKFHFGSVKNKTLGWLTVFCATCIFLNVLRQLNFTLLPNHPIINFLFLFFGLGSLYYMSIASLIQININNIIPSHNELNEERAELETVMKSIIRFIEENKTYTKPDLNLKSFAKEINIPERIISRAINQIEGLNFNSFINNYRINEYKKLACLKIYRNYSIYAIAEEVGFNSRASFYKNFKEIVGIPPSEYQKEV